MTCIRCRARKASPGSQCCTVCWAEWERRQDEITDTTTADDLRRQLETAVAR